MYGTIGNPVLQADSSMPASDYTILLPASGFGASIAGDLALISLYCHASGNLKVKVFRDGGSTWNFIGEQTISVVAGLNTDVVINIVGIQIGDYLGFYNNAGDGVQPDVYAGNSRVVINGDITTNTDKSSWIPQSGWCNRINGKVYFPDPPPPPPPPPPPEVTRNMGWPSTTIADSDTVNQETKMQMHVNYLSLYSPTNTKIIVGANDLPCQIDTFGVGGRDAVEPYEVGDDVWFYWIWGETMGLNTLNSLASPVESPILPIGYTHYSPAFVLKIFDGVSLRLPLPQGGVSLVQVRGNSVLYPNPPMINGGSSYPVKNFDFSTWIPKCALVSNLYIDAEIKSSSAGMVIGGAVASEGYNNFANLSLYPPIASSWYAQDVYVPVVLPAQQMTLTYFTSYGVVDESYGYVFVNGYTF